VQGLCGGGKAAATVDCVKQLQQFKGNVQFISTIALNLIARFK
jgi:hypothetical protein